MIQPGDQQLQEPITLRWLPRPLLVGGILVGVLLASLVIGFLAGRGSLMPFLAALLPPLGVVAAMVAIRYYKLLVLLLPVTALAMRFAVLPTGTASPLPISLVLTIGLVGIWVVSMLTRRVWQVPHTPFNRSLFLFMAICCISLPWGILWRDPILNMLAIGRSFPLTQTASLFSMLASMCVPWLVGYFIDQPWKIKFYLGAFIIFGALMTATQILGINQFFLNDAGLWGLWHVATLFGILLTMPDLSLRWRGLCGILIGANLYLTVVQNSGWISGWLPTIVAMVGIIFVRSRTIFFMIALIGTLYVALGPGREYLNQVVADEIEEGGLGRLEIWERNLGIVAQHWLLGTGPAGYAPYNMTYFPWDARSTHNNYFDILAQFGVVGLLVWCWFMGVSLWFGWKTIGRAPPGLLRTTAIIATSGWVAALFSMVFGDWILPFAYNQGIGGYGYTVYSWIFLGLLVSVHRLQESEVRIQAAGSGAQESGGRRQAAGGGAQESGGRRQAAGGTSHEVGSKLHDRK